MNQLEESGFQRVRLPTRQAAWRILKRGLVIGLLILGLLKVNDVIGLVSLDWLPFGSLKTPRLTQRHESREKIAHGAIVFIHGLGGDEEGTWRNENGAHWYSLMAEDEELVKFDIFTFGYGTRIVSDQTRISSAVNQLRNHLDEEDWGYNRVVVIAHSLGGLIARDALAQSDLRNQHGRLVTLITMGTPFKGSRLADTLKNLTSWASSDIDVLATTNEFQKINQGFWRKMVEDCGGRLIHFAGSEKSKMGGDVFVVDAESAVEGVPPENRHEFPGNHFEIVKPLNKESEVFQKVREWILTRESSQIAYTQIPFDFNAVAGRRYIIGPGELEIEEDIQIPVGATLAILPGTKLRFSDGAILQAEGVIEAVGDEERRIVFDFAKSRTDGLEGGIFLKGPHVEASIFKYCDFKMGNGVHITKPNPKTNQDLGDDKLWRLMTQRIMENESPEKKQSRMGGALVLVGTTGVDIDQCEFTDNQAYIGGAIAAFGARRLDVKNSRFSHNLSGFGGGAIFLQNSEVYADKCNFESNATGPAYSSPLHQEGEGSACGGAIYIGYRSKSDVRSSTFTLNTAANVGGAIAMFDANQTVAEERIYSSICSKSEFKYNSAKNSAAGSGGNAIWIEGPSRLNLTDVKFWHSLVDPKPTKIVAGQVIVDDSRFPEFGAVEGLALNGKIEFNIEGMIPAEFKHANGEYKESLALSHRPRSNVYVKAVSEETAQEKPGETEAQDPEEGNCGDDELEIIESLMEAPRSYRRGRRKEIDTVVIHHVSAINWDDPVFQRQYGGGIKAFEESIAPVPSDEERKYDWRFCKQIFELYRVSSHYMIDRRGVIHQLVSEEDTAYHAGRSKMPESDGREGVNDFSIGIEIISSHPNDDPDVTKESAYTDEQYEALHMLLIELKGRYGILLSNIVGHDQISPGRKTDPGPFFDWKKVREQYQEIP